jgi:hypothetical protein
MFLALLQHVGEKRWKCGITPTPKLDSPNPKILALVYIIYVPTQAKKRRERGSFVIHFKSMSHMAIGRAGMTVDLAEHMRVGVKETTVGSLDGGTLTLR